MAYRTSHLSERPLAIAIADRLADHGFKFTAKFPYNRYDAEHSPWWLSFKGSPAFDVAKVFVERFGESLYTGLMVEKGIIHSDNAAYVIHPDWEWHTVIAKMRDARFQKLLDSQIQHKLRIRIRGGLGTGPGRLEHTLVFRPAPWKRTLDVPSTPSNPLLASVAESGSLTAFLDGLSTVPNADFIWYDLFICVRLDPATSGEDPVVLDEQLVDNFLKPLCEWCWSGLGNSTAGDKK